MDGMSRLWCRKGRPVDYRGMGQLPDDGACRLQMLVKRAIDGAREEMLERDDELHLAVGSDGSHVSCRDPLRAFKRPISGRDKAGEQDGWETGAASPGQASAAVGKFVVCLVRGLMTGMY